MLRLVFFFQCLDLFDDLMGRHAPILIKVPLAMIAEGASAPVASSGGQVWKNTDRHEIAVQRKAVEIGEGERRRFFSMDFLIYLDAFGGPIDQVRHTCDRPLAGQRFQKP